MVWSQVVSILVTNFGHVLVLLRVYASDEQPHPSISNNTINSNIGIEMATPSYDDMI